MIKQCKAAPQCSVHNSRHVFVTLLYTRSSSPTTIGWRDCINPKPSWNSTLSCQKEALFKGQNKTFKNERAKNKSIYLYSYSRVTYRSFGYGDKSQLFDEQSESQFHFLHGEAHPDAISRTHPEWHPSIRADFSGSPPSI